MSWRDPEFQQQLVAFLCKDRQFLKKTSGLLTTKDFTPKRGDSPEWFHIATKALEYWNQWRAPIGGMLRIEIGDFCHEKHIKGKLKEKIMDAVDWIRKQDGLVSVEAVEQKVIQYKQRKAKHEAIQELITAQEKGELTDSRFQDICSGALAKFTGEYRVTDYFSSLEQRIDRRKMESKHQYPFLMIDPVDTSINLVPRGSVCMFLAPWKAGKSVGLIWVAQAYALQGYNVLYITLEDPAEEVENRLDASLTSLPVRDLAMLTKKLRKRFRRMKEVIRGRIKIVDGTEGGISVSKVESIWENERNKGFTADAIIVDYDDEIVPPIQHKGDSGRRFEFADIYREQRRAAAKLGVWWWTAGQASKGAEGKMVVHARQSAEDVSKVRKVALCISIGNGPKHWGGDSRYLYVAAHKFDKQHIGWPIMGNYARTMFYDRDKTFEKLEADRVNGVKKSNYVEG